MDMQIEVSVKSIWYEGVSPPFIQLDWDGDVFSEKTLINDEIFKCTLSGTSGPHELGVTLTNKTDKDHDIVNNRDKAIIIDNITIEGYNLNSVMYASRYRPVYPDHFDLDQHDEVIHSNYLGWNGRWYLPVSFPIFTWIHNQENMGYIHTPNIY